MRSPQQDFRHAAICFCIAGPVWYYEGSSGDAGWSSPVARWAHNPKVAGSNPAPATNVFRPFLLISRVQQERPDPSQATSFFRLDPPTFACCSRPTLELDLGSGTNAGD